MSSGATGGDPRAPKMPIAIVKASLPGTTHSGEFTALIDTGANITLVSKTLIEALNAVIHHASPPDPRP